MPLLQNSGFFNTMEALKKLCRTIIKLNEEDLLDRAYRIKSIIKKIETLNTKEQLFMGIDATGTSLKNIGGEYSPFTKILKARKGLPTNRVTLFDTGKFYDTIKVRGIGQGEAEISANYIKAGVDLRVRWGTHLIGLNKKSQDELNQEIKEYFIRYIRSKLKI